MSFYWFDIVAVAFLLAFILYSSIRGIVKEFFSVAAWVVGYLGTVTLHPAVSPLFREYIKTPVVMDFLVFFVLFISLYVGVRLVGLVASKKLGLERIPSEISHGAAAVMGVAKWFFFVAIFLSPLNLFPEVKSRLLEKSVVVSMVNDLSGRLSVVPAGVDKAKEAVKGNGRGVQDKVSKSVKSVTGEKTSAERTSGAPEESVSEKERKEMDKLIGSLP